MSSLSDSPQYLIGPQLYPAFVRLARWMLPMVLVVAAVVNAAVYLAVEPTPVIGELIAVAAAKAVMAALLTVAILAALFAILERVLSPEQLARIAPVESSKVRGDHSRGVFLHTTHPGLTETVGSLVFIVFLALIPVIPTSFVYAGQLNDGGSFVNPDLWNVWLPVYYGFLVVFAAAEVWKLRARKSTTAMRVVNLVATFVFAAFLTAAVLTMDIVDPVILDDAAWSRSSWADPALVVVIWAVTLWSVITAVRTRGVSDKRLSLR
ncbi:hypothetical protein [Kocuria carniphila]|nr:hypothetical protein [Kocuria carniphila]